MCHTKPLLRSPWAHTTGAPDTGPCTYSRPHQQTFKYTWYHFLPLQLYPPTHTHFHNFRSFLLYPQATTDRPSLHASPHPPHTQPTPTTATALTKTAPSKGTKKNIHPQSRNVCSKCLYTWPEDSNFYKAENSIPKKACPTYWTTQRKPINPEHYKTRRPGRSDLKANTKTSSRTSNRPPQHSNTKGSSPELCRFCFFQFFSDIF
jgi:hypothetical protein